jgi:large subunit ribosomal protein LP0
MSTKAQKFEKKTAYFNRVQSYLGKYKSCFLVHYDHVGSKQIAEIRIALRGSKGQADRGVMLCGKNTMIRKAFKLFLESNPGNDYELLVPKLYGNIALIFTNEDLGSIATIIQENKKEAPARQGTFAPVTVVIPAGPTGADPGATAFFQALQIPTKIQKGQIEITNDVTLVKQGEKVTASHAALLQRLNIKPFFYGLIIQWVYDSGSVFGPEVLALSDDLVIAKFLDGVRNIAGLGLKIGYPTVASIPHSLSNALKHLVAILAANEAITYRFPKAEPYLAYLADPSAFAAAAGPATGAAASSGGAAAAAPVEEEKEEEEEVDAGVGGLFGDDDDW